MATATVVAVSAGCASQPDLAPHPARLVPSGGPAGSEVTVTIEGGGFLPHAAQAASGGPATIETTHTAQLDEVPLTNVIWLDAGRLQATIPASPRLSLGPHRLTVVNALGHAGTLEAAWTVIEPAALRLTVAAPAQVVVGQAFTAIVTAANPGGAALRGVSVRASPTGSGAVVGQPDPPAFDLLPGAGRQLQLGFTGSAVGAVTLALTAGGREDFTGREVTASSAPALLVQAPAALALSATVAPAQASLGQPVTLTVTATNTGGASLRDVAVVVTHSGPGAVTGELTAPAFDLPPGAAQQRQLALVASAAGPVALGVAASGTEALSDRPVAAAAPDAPLLVQTRAALVAALSLPATLAAGAAFQVTMTVENRGQAAALAVAPGALTTGPRTTAGASLVSGPSPASAPVAGDGGQATFTWTWQLAGTGFIELRGGAAGLDGNDGGPVVADPATSNLGGQAPELITLAADPLGDGTPVAALAVRGGRLYVGPSQDGSRFYRLDPASGTGAVLPVEISVDLGPSPASNPAWRASPPATTFGTPGCARGTLACGPDDEDRRGLLAAGTFRGDEWLLAASASSAQPRYLYLARQEGPPLPFASVDLGALLPASAIAHTAVVFAPAGGVGEDRIYAAFTDRTAQRSPRLVALGTAPQAPWLDAAPGSDAFDLGAELMPLVGGSAALANRDPRPRIEAMAWFRDRLYLATGPGLMRSSVAVPRAFGAAPGDWAGVTPVSLAWLRRALPATDASGLTPADRAVPAMAAFGACGTGACLFLARNVEGSSPAVQPQLYLCDASRSGDADACDAFDWSLAAANASGDPGLTQLGVATNGAVGVLVATGRFLYLGFDNAATGVQLYRTAVVPTAIGDFRGRNGCVAGRAGCEGLGGNGLGLGTAVTRLFDARAVTTGGVTTVYVAAGDGAGPLRLFAIPE